jgi:hypothetical protein
LQYAKIPESEAKADVYLRSFNVFASVVSGGFVVLSSSFSPSSLPLAGGFSFHPSSLLGILKG